MPPLRRKDDDATGPQPSALTLTPT